MSKIELYDKNKKYHEGDIIYVNSVLCIIINRRDIDELDLRSCCDRHILDYIRKLQFQHWMDRAKLFEAKSRHWNVIHSEWGSVFAQRKSRLYEHASLTCKKVANERYGA